MDTLPIEALLTAEPLVLLIILIALPNVAVVAMAFMWARSQGNMSRMLANNNQIVSQMIEANAKENDTQIKREEQQARREDRMVAALEKQNLLWEQSTQITKSQTDANIKSAQSSEASAKAVAELAQNMSEIRQGQTQQFQQSETWRLVFDERLKKMDETINTEADKLRQSIDGLTAQMQVALSTPSACEAMMPKLESLIEQTQKLTEELKERMKRETQNYKPVDVVVDGGGAGSVPANAVIGVGAGRDG